MPYLQPSFLLLLIALVTCSVATEPTTKSRSSSSSTSCGGGWDTLLLADDASTIQSTHSQLITSLKARGHRLTIKSADDPSLSLSKYGVFLYDNLIILSPGVEEFGGSISVSSIVSEFVDQGSGNVMVTGSSFTGGGVGDAIRDLATEFGLQIITNDGSTGSNSNNNNYKLQPVSDHLLILPAVTGPAALYDSSKSLVVDNAVTLESTAANSKKKQQQQSQQQSSDKPMLLDLIVTSDKAVLVSGMQTRNNARILFSGSLDMFSDAAFKSSPANEILSQHLTRWVFRETGVLQVASVSHKLLATTESGSIRSVSVSDNSTINPASYTVTDDVVYSIHVQTCDSALGKWIPFPAPIKPDQLQLEFVRIDPFVRINLEPVGSNGVFEARFRIPDVYGVFKFVVDHQRPGLDHLYSSVQVSVVPLRHTQYERFIRSAYPYYFSAFSMMASLVVFSALFLYHSNDAAVTTTTSSAGSSSSSGQQQQADDQHQDESNSSKKDN